MPTDQAIPAPLVVTNQPVTVSFVVIPDVVYPVLVVLLDFRHAVGVIL